jgi:uncharacterized protein
VKVVRDCMRLVVSAGFAGAVLLWANCAQAASFDCGKAQGRAERLICDTPDLNSFDAQLQGAYLGALDRSNHPEQVRARQEAWLKVRDACADAKCMSAAYVRQIRALQGVADEPAVCSGSTTIQIDACQAEVSRRADRELARYVAAARKRLVDDAKEDAGSQAAKAALPKFDAAQAAWVAFRKTECDAVYAWWSDGTIRGAMYQTCWSSLTHSRTADIWGTWLHFGDSTPPLMPDPSKNAG